MDTSQFKLKKYSFLILLFVISISILPQVAHSLPEYSRDCEVSVLELNGNDRLCVDVKDQSSQTKHAKEIDSQSVIKEIRTALPNGRIQNISFYTGQFGSCSFGQSFVTSVSFNKNSTFNPISTSTKTLGCKSILVYDSSGRATRISFYTGQFGSCSFGQSFVTSVSFNKNSTFNPISTSTKTLGCKSISINAQ